MTKKQLWIIGTIACGVICITCILIFLSYFTIVRTWVFEEKASSNSADIIVRVDSTGGRSLGPKAFRIMETSKLPCDLLLEFYATTGTVQSVTIKRLTVRSADGESIDLIAPSQKRNWPLKTNTYSNWQGGGLVYHQTLFVQARITNVISKIEPLVVEGEGEFLNGAEATNPFSFRSEFVPRRMSGIVRTIYLEVAEDAPAGYPLP